MCCITSVDQAEKEIELSNKINSYAPEAFANAVNITNSKRFISTDFVFNGEQNYPYETNQKRNPLITWKIKIIRRGTDQQKNKGLNNTKILRTSWVISPTEKILFLLCLNYMQRKSK